MKAARGMNADSAAAARDSSLGAIFAGGDVARMIDRGILATETVGTAISLGGGASTRLPAGTALTIRTTAPSKTTK